MKSKDDRVSSKKLENNVDPENRKDDELATPDDLFYDTVGEVKQFLGLLPPNLDCFATDENAKCIYWITKEMNAFVVEWLLPDGKLPDGWWINWPHTEHERCMLRLHNQFKVHKVPAILIIPARTRRTHYWNDLVEKFRIGGHPRYKDFEKFIHNWPIHKSNIRFEKNGKPIKTKSGKESHSGNSYEVVVFDPRLVKDWDYEVDLKEFDPKQKRLS